jgi:flagellar biosynthesis protein FliQ
MEADPFIDAAQRAMWVLALASAPMLLPALIVGVLVGIVQAATSINEATLSFIPKSIVVGIGGIVFAGTIGVLLGDFTRDIFAQIGAISR